MSNLFTTINGVKVITFERFCKQNTNGVGRKEYRYKQTYGDIEFEDMYTCIDFAANPELINQVNF